MPRNAGGNKKGQTREYQRNNPDKVYDRLDLSWQRACYNFWIYLETKGEEGWDPDKTPGTINHWRNSLYLQKNIKKRSWNRTGKVRL